MHYFDSLIENSETENLDIHISQNWTTKEEVFPISLQTFEFDPKLLKAPKSLKGLVQQFKQKGHTTIELDKSDTIHSFFNNIIMDIFLFTAAIISMMATAAIIHLISRHTKLNALLTGIAFQLVKQTEAIFDSEKMQQHCTAQWYIIAALTLMSIGFCNLYFCNYTKMHHI